MTEDARVAFTKELYEAGQALADHIEQAVTSFEGDPSDSDFQDGFHAALTTPEMIEFVTTLRAALAKARGDHP